MAARTSLKKRLLIRVSGDSPHQGREAKVLKVGQDTVEGERGQRRRRSRIWNIRE